MAELFASSGSVSNVSGKIGLAHFLKQLHSGSRGFDDCQIGGYVQAFAFQPDSQEVLLRNSPDAELRGLVINDLLEIVDCCL